MRLNAKGKGNSPEFWSVKINVPIILLCTPSLSPGPFHDMVRKFVCLNGLEQMGAFWWILLNVVRGLVCLHDPESNANESLNLL